MRLPVITLDISLLVWLVTMKNEIDKTATNHVPSACLLIVLITYSAFEPTPAAASSFPPARIARIARVRAMLLSRPFSPFVTL